MQRSILAIVLFICQQAAFADYDKDMRMLTAGYPADVADFLERVVECNHWAGEEPYDENRKREINQAVTELNCDALVADESVIKGHYRNDSAVLEAIEKAKGMVY